MGVLFSADREYSEKQSKESTEKMRSTRLFSLKTGLFSTPYRERKFRAYAAAMNLRRRGGLFLASLALFLSTPLFADSPSAVKRFSSAEFGVTFDYSPELDLVSVELPQAVVALRGTADGYPTFNILAAAETYHPAELSESAYSNRILNDYRAVGINDGKSIRTYTAPVAGMTLTTTEVRYQNKDQVIIAAVTLVPGGDNRHYILTYLDLADRFYRRKLVREEIINSLKISSTMPETSSERSESSNYWVKLLFFAIAGLLFGGTLLKLRTRSRTP